VQVNNTDIPS